MHDDTMELDTDTDTDTPFFLANHIYLRNEPFRAPELLEVFWCRAIVYHPKDNSLRAFGFRTNALDRTWQHAASAAMREAHWGAPGDWVEYTEGAWIEETLKIREQSAEAPF